MVYRRLDPASDWNAWCDDHPDPWDYFTEEDFIESDMVSHCCDSEVTIAKNGAKTCNTCCRFCALNDDKSMENLVERKDAEAKDYDY